MKIMFSHIILYMKFTQFIKEFRSAHPDLNMSFKECMQSDDIRGAYKDIIGAGLAKKPAKIAEPKKVQEILGKEAAIGEWKKPPEERGIKGGTKAKRGKDCPPCPPCDRRRCVGDKGKRGGGQQKEYKLKGKENIQIIINNAAPSEGESKPPVTPGVLPMKQEAPFKPYSSDPEEQNRIRRHLGNNRPGGGGDDDDDDDDSGNNDGAEYGQIKSKEDELAPAENSQDESKENEFPPAPSIVENESKEESERIADEYGFYPNTIRNAIDINSPEALVHAIPLPPGMNPRTAPLGGLQHYSYPTTATLGELEARINQFNQSNTSENQTDIPVRKGNYTDTRGARQGVLEKRREKPVVKQTDPTRTDLPVDQPYEQDDEDQPYGQDDEENPSSVYTHPGVHTIIYPPAPQPPYGPYQYPFSPVQHVQHVVPYSVHFNPNPNHMYHMYPQPVHYQPVVQPPVQPRIDTTEPIDVVVPNDPVEKEKKKASRAKRLPVKPPRKQEPSTKPKPVPMDVIEPVNTQESKPAENAHEGTFRSPDVGKPKRKGKVVTEVPDVPAIARLERENYKRSEVKYEKPKKPAEKSYTKRTARSLPTMEVQNLLMPMRRRTDPSSSTDDPSSSLNMLHEPSPELPVKVPPVSESNRVQKEKLPFTPQAHVEGPSKRRKRMPFGEQAPVPAPRSRTPAKRGRAVDEEQPAPVPAPRSRTVADVPAQRQEATPEQYRQAARNIVDINYMLAPPDTNMRGPTWDAAANREANEEAVRLLTQQEGPIYNLRALGDAVRRALRASGRENVEVKSGSSTGFYVGRGLRS